jgi:hypothetical protein
MLTTDTQCDGNGNCSGGATMSGCAGNTRCASPTACAGTGGCGSVAFSDGNCSSDFYCDGVGAGTCVSKGGPTSPCIDNDQCVSGNCNGTDCQ